MYRPSGTTTSPRKPLNQYTRTVSTHDMKIIFTISILSVSQNLFSQEGRLNIRGIVNPNQEILYFHNSETERSNEFCVDSVQLFSKKVNLAVNQPVIEINFNELGLTEGDSVSLEIFHKLDCSPRLLNSQFEPRELKLIDSINISESGNYFLVLKDDSIREVFAQIYIWNKWFDLEKSEIFELNGNKFCEGVIWVPYGKHACRFVIVNKNQLKSYSEEFKIVDQKSKKNSYLMDKTKNTILFIRPSYFEIFNALGERILFGFANEIDISSLNQDVYYMNYEMGNVILKMK